MDITRILAPNPGPFTGAGTNSYVVSSGDEALIVDPGPLDPGHLDTLRACVDDLTVVGVAVTHHHLDHAPAANPLAAEFRVKSYGFGDYGGFQAISPIADGENIHIGTSVITALHTPGHTPDSLCFAFESGLFTGDTIKSGTTVVVEDMGAYMASLERLAVLAPARLYPGHGELIDDGSAVIAEYIRHRRQREKQVLEAVKSGCLTIAEIVAVVYGDIDQALVPLAAQSVRAHLGKLATEGRAEETNSGWREG